MLVGWRGWLLLELAHVVGFPSRLHPEQRKADLKHHKHPTESVTTFRLTEEVGWKFHIIHHSHVQHPCPLALHLPLLLCTSQQQKNSVIVVVERSLRTLAAAESRAGITRKTQSMVFFNSRWHSASQRPISSLVSTRNAVTLTLPATIPAPA